MYWVCLAFESDEGVFLDVFGLFCLGGVDLFALGCRAIDDISTTRLSRSAAATSGGLSGVDLSHDLALSFVLMGMPVDKIPLLSCVFIDHGLRAKCEEFA